MVLFTNCCQPRLALIKEKKQETANNVGSTKEPIKQSVKLLANER